MRLLHTSDWHLGRSLHGVDLLPYQEAHLAHLVDVVRAENVDAVLVAGDVYDRAIPPVEAVEVLSGALARLSELATVVVTSGNHDSATRLGFGSALMRERVRLRTRVADLAEPVALGDDELLVYGLPYLDPDFARRELADDEGTAAGDDEAAEDEAADDERGGPRLLARSHEAVLTAAMRRVRADRVRRAGGARVVVMAHAFVGGGEPSESERDIRVGGVDQVPAGVFAGADYVALGHLHGPQRVAGPGATVLRYSGSPLAFSFGEAGHHKSSVLVELGGAGTEPRVELIDAPVPRRVREVSGRLDDLLGAAGDPYADDWLRVTVTDDARPVDLWARLRARFAHVLVVQHEPAGGRRATGRAAAVVATSDPLVVAGDFVAHVTGAAPSAAEAAVLRRAYEDVLAAERSA